GSRRRRTARRSGLSDPQDSVPAEDVFARRKAWHPSCHNRIAWLMQPFHAERLAFAFLLGGNNSALSAEALQHLSPAGRVLLDVCSEMPAEICAIGLEATARVWRRSLMPRQLDVAFPTRDHYAAVLRLARAIERTTVGELAAQPWPDLLLIQTSAALSAEQSR